MKIYLMSIIISSLCISVLNLLIPKGSGLEKYTKLIGMLILLITIISPLSQVINKFDIGYLDKLKDDILDSQIAEEEKYSDILDEYLRDHSVEQYKLQIKDLLLSKFDIPNEECEINISVISGQDRLEIKDMQILLSGKSIFKNPYEIEEYFIALIGCECRVLIKNQ